MSKKPETGFNY